MALGLLCLMLILLGTVKTQDQEYNRTAELAAALKKVVLNGNLQHEKFQGKWYALAMAFERIQNVFRRTVHVYSVTYSLRHDHSFQVTTIIFRPNMNIVLRQTHKNKDPRLNCLRYSNTFSPTDDPTQFILETSSRNIGMHRYSMNVLATNYDEYAVVSFGNEFEDKVSTYLMLYGRNKTLSPHVKEHFDLFTKYMDLTDDNVVLYVPTDECIDDS